MNKLISFLFILSFSAFFCCTSKKSDEAILWEYYSGFSYPPELFDSLRAHAKHKDTKQFLLGLRCFEKYDQLDSVSCYDSALIIFNGLISASSKSYLGYMGKGILLTERGRKESAKGKPYYAFIDSADYYYEQATLRAPNHGAIYYYRGRNQYNRKPDSINLRAIAYLDTAAQLKDNFFKANERSAEFLSHYYNLSMQGSGNESSFRSGFPNIEDRIKYYFNKSLSIDSSWYETYRGIANANRIYSAKERIDYLKTGISISKRKHSKDSLDLMVLLMNIYFHDLKDYEYIRKSFKDLRKLNPEVRKMWAWTNFYLVPIDDNDPRKNFYSIKSDDGGAFELYQYHRLSNTIDSARYYLRQAIRLDSSRDLVFTLEKAKLDLLEKKTAAAKLTLRSIIETSKKRWGADKSDHTEYNKAYYLLNSMEGY